MRLLMIESDEKGIWYFTTIKDCADFLDVTTNAVRYWVAGVCPTCKGFTHREWIEDDNIISAFINPTREKYITLYGEDAPRKAGRPRKNR